MKHHKFVILDNALRGAWYSDAKFPLSEALRASARQRFTKQKEANQPYLDLLTEGAWLAFQPQPVQPSESASVCRLAKMVDGQWTPASEFFTSTEPSWEALVKENPEVWKIQWRVTGRQIAAGIKLALASWTAEVAQASYAVLRDAITAMAEDGWLQHGPEGMSEAQEKCYVAYTTITAAPQPKEKTLSVNERSINV